MTMRLIDADDLHELIDGGYDIDFSELPETKRELLRMIDEQSTIDAVPVVLCKDCEHHEDEEPGMVYCPNQVGGWVSEDFFCADGGRREDECTAEGDGTSE